MQINTREQAQPGHRRITEMNHAHINLILSGVLLISAMLLPFATAEPLRGGVTINESLPKANLKLNEPDKPKYDSAPPKGLDCLCFNPQRVQAKEINGSWKIVDGDHWILDFSTLRNNAIKSVGTISYYNMSQICFVGRNSGQPMMYFLCDGKAPEGKIDGENSITFDPGQVRVEEIEGSWKLTSGSLSLEDFGNDEGSARDAAEQVRYYGFTRKCSIERSQSPMRYYVK
jgi:hypothetical protein